MRWYKNRDVKLGEISHPADREEWKFFDRRYPSFAQEIRNIRLGLATDGFNPFGPTRKKTYSVWPLVIVVYNLPPSMCMKKPFMFMTDIVPGPNSTGKYINVCLRPLIDELKILWNTGVKIYDQSLKQNFTMRAALMWTISDYPAMIMISGWSGKGKMGCQSKDHKKARADCKHFGVLSYLWIDEKGKSPKAPYFLTRKQRKLLCEWISALKLPDGYSSNISRCCNVEECIFYGFKSHDCHIFLQKLLPLAIRELLPAPIADAITVDKDEVERSRFKDLLEGPVLKVMTFETCQVNGYKFSTKSASGSGIVVKGNLHGNNLDYYGQLQEIIRLIYQGCNHVYLFRCIWFDSVGNGVRIDKNRVVTIDMTSRLKSNEIFILASQASQVYYAPSVMNPKAKMSTVVKSKNRPIDESIIAQNDIEDAFQEDRSNASTSFSLFVNFAQYG
ncbi:uncharacterized protein LOC141719578 [Apium graveolens]|uniref:uncharacterized protein LOC141719578 n=1 Tax=Apium graveolens TaxID=4045 RepID=UPI003D792E18